MYVANTVHIYEKKEKKYKDVTGFALDFTFVFLYIVFHVLLVSKFPFISLCLYLLMTSMP